MVIKVKDQVEIEITVPVPVAAKTDYFHYIINKDGDVLKFNNNLIVRYTAGDKYAAQDIREAINGKIIPMSEAQRKFIEVLKSFELTQSNIDPLVTLQNSLAE